MARLAVEQTVQTTKTIPTTTLNMPARHLLEKFYWYFFAGLVLLLTFLCFYQLGAYPVGDWDEARHGTNAFEMMQKSNYVVNYYNGEPDYWNLKPPLSYYLVMLGYRIFGYNAWGLRFFSALSYFLLAVIIALYVKNRCGKIPSLLSLALFSGGFIFFVSHFVRTGDADAAYVLCIGVAIITLEIAGRKPYCLCLTGLLCAGAFLLKSWHAFVMLPIIFFAYIFTKLYKNLRWYHYLLALLSAILPILIWVVCRYHFDGATFFQQMVDYDLLARSKTPIEGHTGSIFFYVGCLIKNPIECFCAIVCGVGISLKLIKRQKFSNLEIVCMIAFISIFVIYTVAKTKLDWYVYPCCVPLFIGAADFLPQIIHAVQVKRWAGYFSQTCCLLILIACVVVSFVVVGYQTQRTDELQNFIAACEIQDGNIYYQTESTTSMSQGAFLCLQWRTGRNLEDGGFDQFLTDHGAYLIVSKQFVENHGGLPDEVSVVRTSTNYWLCFYH